MLLLALLLAAAADAGAPAPKLKWQVPDLESWVDVPGTQVVNGLPVRFSAAVSRHDIPYLMDFYGKEFVKAGLYIPPAKDMKAVSNVIQLTGLDTEALVSYTVIFQPIDMKRTTVIMSEGRLEPWLKQGEVRDFVPLLPNAASVVRTHSEDGDLLTYSTAAKASEVTAFYAETLGKAGYAPGLEPGLFVKAGEQIKLTVREPKPGGGSVVLIERRNRPR